MNFLNYQSIPALQCEHNPEFELIPPQITCDLYIGAHSVSRTFRTQFSISLLLFSFYNKSKSAAPLVQEYCFCKWSQMQQQQQQIDSLPCIEPVMWNSMNAMCQMVHWLITIMWTEIPANYKSQRLNSKLSQFQSHYTWLFTPRS